MYPLIVNFSPIYYFMFVNLNKYTNNKKISRNYCSIFHIIGCLILSILKYYNNIFFNINILLSIGYFIFDTIYILGYSKYNLFNICMIYHHVAICYLLTLDHNIYQSDDILLLGEISNIPGNIIYHYIQIKDDKYMEKLKIIQKYLYFIIRVIFYSYIIFERLIYLKNNNYSMIPLMTSFPVYIMGLIWSCKLIL